MVRQPRASKARRTLEYPSVIDEQVLRYAELTGKSANAAIEELICIGLKDSAYAPTPGIDPTHSRVEYLLRTGRGSIPGEPLMGPDWASGSGRWLLDWFLQSEPDWQTMHTVYLPRHWPLQVSQFEHRCLFNGGAGASVNDEISSVSDTDQDHHFPSDFGLLSPEEWLEVVSRYRGCCGERLRRPDDGHWDAICDLPQEVRDGLLTKSETESILSGKETVSSIMTSAPLSRASREAPAGRT